MSAGRYDLKIDQGADYRLALKWKDTDGVAINLQGWKVCLQIRNEITSKAIVLEIHNQLLTDENIILTFTAAQTSSVKIDPKKLVWVEDKQAQLMVYDIELTAPDGKKSRFIQGFARIYPQVTQC